MNFITVLSAIWPIFLFIFAALGSGAWWAISNHFAQKARIDVLETKLENHDMIIVHLTDVGKDIKAEQVAIKSIAERTENNYSHIMDSIREMKELLERLRK